MRIAIVSDFYYPSLGGITEHVDGQARALTALGHEVTVVTGRLLRPPPVQDDTMAVPEPTFEVVRIGTALRLYVPRWGNGAETTHTIGPRLGRRLGAFFRERGFDVVHVHAPYNPQMPAWAIDNTPEDAISVATFHSVFPQTLGMDIEAELIRPAIERLDGRICVSEACIGSLTPYFPYAYDVIPNGIDADHFSPAAEPVRELMGDHRSIVFVGRFDPRNGVDTMIQAHARLFAERGPSVRLIVVGDGPLRPLLRADGGRAGAPLRPLRRPPQPQPAQLPGHRRRVLHALRARLVRDGAAGGDELRAGGRGQPHQRLPAGDGGRPSGLPGGPGPLAGAVRRRAGDGCWTTTASASGWRPRAAAPRSSTTAWPRVGAQLETYYADLMAGRRPVWASARSSASS